MLIVAFVALTGTVVAPKPLCNYTCNNIVLTRLYIECSRSAVNTKLHGTAYGVEQVAISQWNKELSLFYLCNNTNCSTITVNYNAITNVLSNGPTMLLL